MPEIQPLDIITSNMLITGGQPHPWLARGCKTSELRAQTFGECRRNHALSNSHACIDQEYRKQCLSRVLKRQLLPPLCPLPLLSPPQGRNTYMSHENSYRIIAHSLLFNCSFRDVGPTGHAYSSLLHAIMYRTISSDCPRLGGKFNSWRKKRGAYFGCRSKLHSRPALSSKQDAILIPVCFL